MNSINENLCPVCKSKLQINRLVCPNCKAEYPVNDYLSSFNYLSGNQKDFLYAFLKNRGNIKFVCDEMGISYPTAKKRLDNLLTALGMCDEQKVEEEVIDLSNIGIIDKNSTKASEIIKGKLCENGGLVNLSLLNGKPCRIKALDDGKTFLCDKLPLPLEYTVFDVISDFLLKCKGYRAQKGTARGKEDKVGYGKCTVDTVSGALAVDYFGKKVGESTLDTVFVLAAIMDWAGIAKNERGYLSLTADYIALRNGNEESRKNLKDAKSGLFDLSDEEILVNDFIKTFRSQYKKDK